MEEAKRMARLASVVSRAFPGKTTTTTKGLRLAAVSEALGREVKSFKDLTEDEIKNLLTRWENAELPWTPHPKGVQEINDLAKLYQERHGQVEMAL